MLLYTIAAILGVIILYSLYVYFSQKKAVTSLSQEEFVKGYRKAQLIDVREPGEYEAGHILGARNIPLTQLKTRMKKEIRPDKPVYLYCQSGMRSGRAAKTLRKNGYHDLYHLEGGFKKWTGKVKSK
ncbi:Rhodanese-like domain protein [Bacillus thermotolerans]|uniref:Rhodanese-like domain protein n=1 Tax=Bacillus thermotolerans TaxID=1221996 RepID=A0A0F5HW27_BACTR|nr:Rhodanese-like domain protein [Bacillus thermotolerans]KKB42937.1 Rhodanese-like domain protein [Bacillus thermotolerans]KKB43843.1 Rhodanese-like domain protein [Bacillus thermotolerans]